MLAPPVALHHLQHEMATGRNFRRSTQLASRINMAVKGAISDSEPDWTTRFFDLVNLAVSAICQDPRDKVPGLLVVLPYVVTNHIKPRFERKPSIGNVYASFSKAFPRAGGKLDTLLMADTHRLGKGMQSWAFDFSANLSQPEPVDWKASGDLPEAYSFNEDDNSLKFGGVFVAEVVASSIVFALVNGNSRRRRKDRQLIDLATARDVPLSLNIIDTEDETADTMKVEVVLPLEKKTPEFANTVGAWFDKRSEDRCPHQSGPMFLQLFRPPHHQGALPLSTLRRRRCYRAHMPRRGRYHSGWTGQAQGRR